MVAICWVQGLGARPWEELVLIVHLLYGLLAAAAGAAGAAGLGLPWWVAILAFVVGGNLGVLASAGLTALESRSRPVKAADEAVHPAWVPKG
jgi:hypothetical protein